MKRKIDKVTNINITVVQLREKFLQVEVTKLQTALIKPLCILLNSLSLLSSHATLCL